MKEALLAEIAKMDAQKVQASTTALDEPPSGFERCTTPPGCMHMTDLPQYQSHAYVHGYTWEEILPTPPAPTPIPPPPAPISEEGVILEPLPSCITVREYEHRYVRHFEVDYKKYNWQRKTKKFQDFLNRPMIAGPHPTETLWETMVPTGDGGKRAWAECARGVVTGADFVDLLIPHDEYQIRKGMKGWSVRVWFEDDW